MGRLDKMKSRDELYGFWRSPTGANQPANYLSPGRNERSEFLVRWIRDGLRLPAQASILELGCNAGRNLSFLWGAGYQDLAGIEINQGAIDLLCQRFPHIRPGLMVGPIEEHILQLSGKYTLMFSMAVLVHLHPSSDWIFREMVEHSEYILTVEDEYTNRKHHTARNYKDVFESLGMVQILYERRVPGMLPVYAARAFRHAG